MKKLLSAIMMAIMVISPLLKPAEAHAASVMFTSVASQHNTTLALDANGRIWGWGWNVSGNLGDGTVRYSYWPKQITVTDNGVPVSFKEVKPGFNASLALDTNGNIWGTGDNGSGQLGLGSGTASVLVWTKLQVTDGGSAVVFKKIASLRGTSFALDSNGQLWIWGFRTGSPDFRVPTKQSLTDNHGNPAVFTALEGSDENGMALDSSNHLWRIYDGAYSSGELTVMDGGTEVEFQSIFAGGDYGSGIGRQRLALDTNGELWSWGPDEEGQQGNGAVTGIVGSPTKLSITDNGNPVKLVKITAGNMDVLALDTNGDMWTWGRNASGQLGDNTTVHSDVPHKVPVSDNGIPFQFTSLFAGYEVSYGLDANGLLWAWGGQGNTGNYGLLGDGGATTGQQLTPKRVYIQPQLSLSASVTSSTYLEPVTFTAAVTGAEGLHTPAGAVRFFDNGQLSNEVSLAVDGTAELTTSSLIAGSHNISALYMGDSMYASGVMASKVVTVVKPEAPVVMLTPSTTVNTTDPVNVSVTVQTYGASNSLAVLKWLPGDNNAAAFVSAGTDILAAKSFVVSSNGIYTVYAKDAAGNEAVNKIDIQNLISLPNNSVISPAAAGFDKYTGSVAHADVTTTLTLNGNTLTGIMNGAATLTPDTDYTVTGSTATISKAYLQAQPTGSLSLTFVFSAGAAQTLTITVSDSTPVSSGSHSKPSSTSTPGASGEPEKFIIAADASGGIVINVQASALVTETEADGTVIQKLILPEDILNQAAEQLKGASKPVIIIRINDTEKGVQVQLSGTFIAALAQSYPNAAIVTELNRSSLELKASVPDLAGLAKRLGVALSDLKIVTSMERASKSVGADLERIGTNMGFQTVGSPVNFRVMAEANGRSVEIRDFGGAYMVRAIVYNTGSGKGNVIAIQYDPVTGTVSYIPTHLSSRADGSKEAVMKAPHYSIYAVIETKDRSFTDMMGHWAKQDVELLASRLIVNGVSADRYVPEDSVTRAEFASLLVRSMGLSLEHDEGYKGFSDVSSTAWYARTVEAAVKAKLVNGVEADRFDPDGRISREQMAVMIARALTITSGDDKGQENNQTLAAFTDHDAIESWSKDSVGRTVRAGIIEGMDGGRFAPSQSATRAQAAAMLKRFLKKVDFIE
ncbi:S-layer homology domain-containing protein [Paenibacillus rigui]|uniref:SLH domain-containing protein n=1 Tax=Paenibacillus rigui TaxID=554312 RepID=A0A229ULU2_9BACL|nr:S-layer homology domain-containing protein [Paenibacillus rigui]OXM84341.1 hypothetical protein CF651_21405 [Paenibacillus rigui]